MASWNVHAALAIMVVMVVSGAAVFEQQDCENLRLICEDEIFKRIFTDATVTVSDKCCLHLLLTSRGCLEGLVKTDLQDPYYKNHTKLAQQVLAKTEQMWNNCTSVSHNRGWFWWPMCC
ncbi:hypothetical protein GQ457_13G003470 [Hibiscus cannabinus]